ncbi:MAG: hypothetical protein ACI9U2_003250 [Bradymonadia bacterium]|jgi:uncharacterized protein with NRDE domain
MCTILIGVGTDPRAPIVIAANRDEFFARASSPPAVLQERGPRIVGGRDLKAGGTWMGVTDGGYFVGLTNQRTDAGPDPQRRSRGALVMDALRRADTPAIGAWLATLDPRDFNPFNLLFGDASGLKVAYARDAGLRIDAVPPGFSVLPNDVLDSTRFPKVERARGLVDGSLVSMERALADTHTPAVPTFGRWPHEIVRALHRLCVQTPEYGTVSATSVALTPGGVTRYAFCDGRPGEAPFVDSTGLLV